MSRWLAWIMWGLGLLMTGPAAYAGVGRFVTGLQGWGVPPGWNVTWNTSTLLYYTDPGPLSPAVTHAQADAMVAAAAAVWNVPTSSLWLAQGGVLGEDISTANTYFNGTGVVFPSDAQVSNEGAIPVAIVYDADGSLVDLLLGEGASETDGCRQNAVVGDVDDIHQSDGHIYHATLILNGNCVGSDPEQLIQMQYQLARAFGRILGLSWSQTNDNVFTGGTTVTANQLAFWPLMHPMDVICGNYSYQCMTNPFTLRVDDFNTLSLLYPVWQSAVPPGKQGTRDDALWLMGVLFFPTGQGMEWANVATHRFHNGLEEDWQTTSSMTGATFLQAEGTPVDSTPATVSGNSSPGLDGYYDFGRVMLDGLSNVFFTSEAINPLYTGDYAIGPYVRNPVAPSGSPATFVAWSASSPGDVPYSGSMWVGNAASSCSPGSDGTESAPALLDQSGWQSGLICGWGHNSWWQISVKASHTWAVEVTATDETGSASVNKMQPVVGVWGGGDATGTLPTVASQTAPFNSMVLGMTQVTMDAAPQKETYRVSVSDQFGAGRPDFTYVARFLYADSVAPASVGSGGGQIVISGEGFQQGNQILVNGVPARVLSWTANQIVADAPAMALAGVQAGVSVAVTVIDGSTGGTTTIPAAVQYNQTPDLLVQVSAPAALETGVTAAVPFSVRVVASDGLSPVANAPVNLAVLSGSGQLGICGGTTQCVVTADSNGLVQTTITGEGAGQVLITATETTGGASVELMLADSDPVRAVSFLAPQHWVAAGANGSWTLQLNAAQDGEGAPGLPVVWTVSAGLYAGAEGGITDSNGMAQLAVSASSVVAGSVGTVTGCVWQGVCATWTMYGVDPSQWVISVAEGAAQKVPTSGSLGAVLLAATDTAGHVLEGAPVEVYQRVLAWEGPCGTAGPCASAPVLSVSQSALYSDGNGVIRITPLEVEGVPQVVEIAISFGLEGLIALNLEMTP